MICLFIITKNTIYMEIVNEKKQMFSRVDNLMWKVTKLLTRRKKAILDEYNLTCSQFDILAAVYQSIKTNSEVIQIYLSKKAQIDPMTTSTVLRNLQKRDLIKRERGLINTRTIEVKLTEKGEKLFLAAQNRFEDMKEHLYENLDQQQFTSQLLKLSDTLIKSKF